MVKVLDRPRSSFRTALRCLSDTDRYRTLLKAMVFVVAMAWLFGFALYFAWVFGWCAE
jgi:hypothetical protein